MNEYTFSFGDILSLEALVTADSEEEALAVLRDRVSKALAQSIHNHDTECDVELFTADYGCDYVDVSVNIDRISTEHAQCA